MQRFDLILTLQMIIYWVLVPLFSITFGKADYNLYHIFPYAFFIVLFMLMKNDYVGSVNLSLEALLLSNTKIFAFLSIGWVFLLTNDYYGRHVFGMAQERNSSFSLVEAILYKSIEIGIPLILCEKFSSTRSRMCDLFVIFACITTLFLLYGASKGVLVSIILYYIIFSKGKIGLKKLAACLFLIVIAFAAIFYIRDEQSGLAILYYFLSRLDGISLTSIDPANEISTFSGNTASLAMYFNSIARFFDQSASDQFAHGLVGAKPDYLFRLGADELDYSISLPSEMVILFGYIPGLIITFALVLMLRRIIAITLVPGGTRLSMIVGFSVVLNLILLEQSIFSSVLNPIKYFPLLLVLSFLLAGKAKFNDKDK